MRSYKIISPPFTQRFRDLKKSELKAYYDWYLSIIPERIKVLAEAVKSTAGYERWKPDFSPNSLDLLEKWFAKNIETRRYTKEEKENIYAHAPSWFKQVDINEKTLTARTLSIAFDMGMYVSQVFLRNHPTLKWSHELGRKDHIDYGHPVIAGFRKGLCFNPTHILQVHAYGLIRNQKKRTMKALYDVWIEDI